MGYDSKQLAKETGIGESTIRYYLRGDRIPSSRNMRRMAEVLQCDEEEISEE